MYIKIAIKDMNMENCQAQVLVHLQSQSHNSKNGPELTAPA